MTFLASITLFFFAVASQAFAETSVHLQPDCFPVPNLPHDFSMKPDHWPHSTPLLQPQNKTAARLLAKRQTSTYWSGWENIHYWFPL
jgi:hypothetical protein